MENFFIQTFLLTLLFISAGFEKINDFSKTVNGLKNKVNLDIDFDLYKLAIIIVIILEIFAPLIILNSIQSKKYYKHAYYATLSLIIFTVLATYLYHLPATGSNYYKILSNIALIGGLLLLSDKLLTKSQQSNN